ncbi:hypothetical protein NC981_06500 [Leptolyngbya sp. DQ-M1]|uniref:hypothetical protein n=1 Tax=Leptolyngbya sp. DQ-M1 TaxID=2933920 RepID=UPI003299680F
MHSLHFGFDWIRSTVLASTLIAVSSLPSFAIPQSSLTSSQVGNSTATQVIAPYQAPPQLLVIQRPPQYTSSFTQGAGVTIAQTAAHGLPRSLEIGYALTAQLPRRIGGGGTDSLPQLVFVPQGVQNTGGEILAPVRSSIQTYQVQTDQGFLEQTTQNVINFSL